MAFEGSLFSFFHLLGAASFSSVTLSFLALIVAYYVISAIYSATLHPLAKFPGPTSAACSRIPWWVSCVTGEQVSWLLELHAQYGPVVRFAPDDLSYADARAWKEIHDYKKGRKENAKAKEIIPPAFNGTDPIIIADHAQHTRVRRIFSPAFSDRALRKEEPLFRKHADMMCSRLRQACVAGDALDMVKIFNFTTFDTMSDMCFGRTLGLLENNEYSPWVNAVFQSVKMIPFIQIIEYYPALKLLYNLLEPKVLSNLKTNHFKHSANLVDERLARGSDQPDLWNMLLSAESSGEGLTLEEMHSNADFFMVAGSETSATALSGFCYYLLMNPDKLKRVTSEIRGAFPHSSTIDIERLPNLKYLNACLQETLRMYPPVPNGVRRVIPEGGQTILGQWVPPDVRVSIHHSATYRSPKNFRHPDTFAPERWLDDATDTGSEYKDDRREACQPFSTGPRNCLGQNMAWYQMRLLAVKLLVEFDLELCPESHNWADQKVYSLWEKKALVCKLKFAS